MFAAHTIPSTPTTPFSRSTGHYTPVRPSPLRPCSSNINTPPWTMGSSPTRGAKSISTKLGVDENAYSPVSFPSFYAHGDQTPQPKQQQQAPTLFGNIPSTTSSSHHQNHQQSTVPPMSPTSPTPSRSQSTPPSARYATRYASQIASPLKTSTSLARSKTRKMFLNRVKNDRDSGRFEARGEQMMHMEYLAEKRRWEESMARDVDGIMVRDEDLDLVGEEMIPDEDISSLDEYVVQEEEAMQQAFFETMDSTTTQQNFEAGLHSDLSGSFSDDEYEDIFNTISQPALSSQDMDMS